MSSALNRTLGAARACACAIGLGALSSAAEAFPTVWEFRGTLTEVPAGVYPSDFAVGAPFRVVVGFDTAATLTRSRPSSADPVTGLPRPGVRYEYDAPTGLRVAIFIGESCNPCTIEPGVDFDPAQGLVFVRDDYQDLARNGTPEPVDGISWGIRTLFDGTTFSVIFRDLASAFSPQLVAVTGSPPQAIALEPDPRLVQQATRLFEVCAEPGACLRGGVEAVSIPSYGSYYFLSARHCGYPDLNPNSAFAGDDCIVGGGAQPLVQDVGGIAGLGDFARTFTPSFPAPGQATPEPLGSVFGAVSFGGPGGLPVLRGSAVPTDVARDNSNLLAYQEYVYGGSEATDLALVANLGYSIRSHVYGATPPLYRDGRVIAEGVRAGGAQMNTVLAIVDASRVPAVSMAALRDFNSLRCGAEQQTATSANGTVSLLHRLPDGSPWPAGAILGAAVYTSPEGETADDRSVVLKVFRCEGNVAVEGEPVRVAPGDRFYLAASAQTPARGRAWYNGAVAAPADLQNGFVDAANTIVVLPDPQAPAAVLRQLAAGLAPACTDCGFEPEVRMDLKPDSVDNTVNPGANGVIPVAVLGSERFQVHEVDVASLRLGTLTVRRKGKSGGTCATTDVNGDGLPDLLCHFENVASNWVAGQTVVTLSGKLTNGELIFASDSVRLVQ